MDAEVMNVVGRLNPICRQTLEEAAELCSNRTHYSIEVEHFLFRLLEQQNTDVHRVLNKYNVKPAVVSRELISALDRFKRGNSRMPQMSPQVPKMFQEAWNISSLQLGSGKIRSGATLQALLDHDQLRGLIVDSVPSLRAIPPEALKAEMRDVIRQSQEEDSSAVEVNSGEGEELDGALGGIAPGSGGKSLDKYTVDLTAQARAGRIDPITGRDPEIRQIIDILTRRRQNNPLLAGEAGVGKTAIVEGFAQRVVKGDVPPQLKDVAVRVLDLALLQAGASMTGEFENRLKSVIGEVKASATPIILFIDEAHTIIGAGGKAPGQGDAANLLKPALARGELRTIAATTWSEYKQYFEKDAALTRRFQVVKVDEPDDEAAIVMLRGVSQMLEKHHNVKILDEAIAASVHLSRRYLQGRHLPDKAISVLDTACARVGVGLTGTPAEVEDSVRAIELMELEKGILEREVASGREHTERLKELTTGLEKARERHEVAEKRWGEEREAVKRIHELENELEETRLKQVANSEDAEAAEAVEDAEAQPKKKKKAKAKEHAHEAPSETNTLVELRKEREALAVKQGETPMVFPCVDSSIVSEVISAWTGVPVGRMLTDEIKGILKLEERLSGRIIGQPQSLDAVCRRIRTSKAKLDDPNKPVGVFLFVGPSGVGKTETAVAVSEAMFGGSRNMVVCNMSEYQEAHTVSNLKGSPPGYVGYGKGGVLTEAVRRNPYSLILLDEIEKAHPDVLELFYQVFDKGQIEDAEGIEINFKSTIILLTSNVGTDIIMKACEGGERPDPAALADLIRPALLKSFKPAFLGRMVVVPYYPLRDEELRKIVQLKLGHIQDRFREGHHAELTYDESLVAAIAGRCTEVDSGARNVDAILTHSFLPSLSDQVLELMATGEPVQELHASLTRKGTFLFKPVGKA